MDFDPTFFDKPKRTINAYLKKIKERPLYQVRMNIEEGWCQYKGLKHTRTQGWWKDAGFHGLCRKMAALGLPDGPIKYTYFNPRFTKDEAGNWTGQDIGLWFPSMYWCAAHELGWTDARGSFYYRFSDSLKSFEEED